MDKKTLLMLLAGTMTRGILWLAAGVSGHLGVTAMSEETGSSLGYFIASLVVAGFAMLWSKKKDGKLLVAKPPKE